MGSTIIELELPSTIETISVDMNTELYPEWELYYGGMGISTTHIGGLYLSSVIIPENNKHFKTEDILDEDGNVIGQFILSKDGKILYKCVIKNGIKELIGSNQEIEDEEFFSVFNFANIRIPASVEEVKSYVENGYKKIIYIPGRIFNIVV